MFAGGDHWSSTPEHCPFAVKFWGADGGLAFTVVVVVGLVVDVVVVGRVVVVDVDVDVVVVGRVVVVVDVDVVVVGRVVDVVVVGRVVVVVVVGRVVVVVVVGRVVVVVEVVDGGGGQVMLPPALDVFGPSPDAVTAETL